MGWFEFSAAFFAFFVTHRIPTLPSVRDRLVNKMGSRGFLIAYSAVSLLMLWWLISAAGRAPHITLWPRAPWQTWVPVIAMVLVCLLLSFGVARPNPLSFGGARNDQFDPEYPGITRWIRHPVLVAFALWAGAHLIPNGDLAHVMLFGLFAGFAMLGMVLIDRRKQREMGQRWRQSRTQIGAGPWLPRPESWRSVALRLCTAVLAYAVLVILHPFMLGVSPLP